MPGEDAWPYVSFLFHHGLVSQEAYEAAFLECKFGDYMTDCNANFSGKTDACWDAIYALIGEMPDPIDIYDIDAEVCVQSGIDGALNRLQYTSKWSSLSRFVMNKLKKSAALNGMPAVRYEQNNRVDPCLSNYIPLYLNRADVQKAIHVDKTTWKEMGNINYGSMDDDMVVLYQEFFNNPRSSSWRILLFSGDFDLAIPFESTQRWIHCLGRPVVKPWHSWMVGSQVGGNVIEYDRISYLTVKGSGHMVPYYTPDKGYTFFQKWIDKEPFY